jgi:hypothetical protein
MGHDLPNTGITNIRESGAGAVFQAGASRRTFVKVSAAAVGSLLLSICLPTMIDEVEAAGNGPANIFAPNAFIRNRSS